VAILVNGKGRSDYPGRYDMFQKISSNIDGKSGERESRRVYPETLPVMVSPKTWKSFHKYISGWGKQFSGHPSYATLKA
jgi:hypothetical protein